MYSIYVHTTPDGKKYVGSTSLKPKIRFNGGSNYKTCTRFNDAINFFGWNNIKHEILETVEDKETALKREEYYTLLWRTNEPEFGYNICYGNKGRKESEDTKKKKSEKMKGRITYKKPIKLKNKNTGEIFIFDCQKSCAEFFSVSNASVSQFFKGTHTSEFFSDYIVLKTVKKINTI